VTAAELVKALSLLTEDEALPYSERVESDETVLDVSVKQLTGADSIPQLPPFLEHEAESAGLEHTVFVARERELAQLDEFLAMALAGQGRVAFVTGEAGQGKTSLVNEFVRQAQASQAELIVASGHCNAYAGVGDPYLPFRDVMDMLTGAVEAKWAAGAITREHARRLWHLLPVTVQALLEAGPDLIDVFVRGTALVGRATTAVPSKTAWLEQLKELTAPKPAGSIELEQSYLFEQYARVLHILAAQRPLLITLDDLQWADAASISLLFHLGRRIGGSRILIVGAYRPDEVALGWDGERHPLEKVLGEFKRTFGDIWLELAQAEEAEGRGFVDVLLDTQPNRLGAGFRQTLYQQTGGHPLFTVELLRAMQARGDLVQDEEQRWVEGPTLDWQKLPARVEGVIEERIGRLEAELREVLAVASVEGENFTAEVVTRVQGLSQRQLLQQLSQELQQRHHLVREREEVKAGQQLLSRYQFAHILFQRYLYDSLSAGERRLLHGEIAQALATIYEGHTDEIAAQLVHHFLQAGERVKAIDYARQAARGAKAIYAYDEAIQHLQTALDLLETGEQVETQLALLEELGDVHRLLRKDAQAVSLYQAALEQWSSLASTDGMIAMRLHRKILGLVPEMTNFEEFEALSQTWAGSRAYLEASLPLAGSEAPQLELVRVLTTLANDRNYRYRFTSDLDRTEGYAHAAVDMAAQLDAPVELSAALGTLANVYFARGLLPEQLEASRRRLALSRDPRFGDLREKTKILDGLCDALILHGDYAQAIPYLLEEESLASQIRAADLQALALGSQALCWFRLDRWDELFKVDLKLQELEQRYSREQIGPICVEISLSAAARALRGDIEQARDLRERAYAIMVRTASGESPENWARPHHY
jgi:tetratricopeptide (TPR) repeat protein